MKYRLALPVVLVMISLGVSSDSPAKASVLPASSATGSAPKPLDRANSSAVSVTPAAPAAGEQIKWQVISAGGNRGTSTNYVLNGTAGQTTVGAGTSPTYRVNQGFWQNFSPTSCCDKPGDANNDGAVNVGDAVYIINYVFKGGPTPPCKQEADANADAAVNVGDAVYAINYVFKGGPAPVCGP